MPNPLEIPLMQLGRIIVALKPVLIDAVGVEAVHYVDDNFRLQGYQGATLQPWPRLKKTDKKRPGRAILVDTGNLRKSIKQTNSSDHTTISTDVVYARAHNEGLTISHPARSVILSYRQGKGGKLKLAKRQTEAQRLKIRDIRQGDIGAHNVKMPRRQFMPTADNPSPILTQRCQAVILRKVTQALPK